MQCAHAPTNVSNCETHVSLGGVVAIAHISQDFVPFLVDASLVPAFEGALDEAKEVTVDCFPLACRRKSDAPHREGMVQSASPAHCCNLGVPAMVLNFATLVFASR